MDIKEGMDFDAWTDAWIAAAQAKGHTLRKYRHDTSSVDVAAYAEGFHNGPICETCGWTNCMHCDFYAKRIPDCPKRG